MNGLNDIEIYVQRMQKSLLDKMFLWIRYSSRSTAPMRREPSYRRTEAATMRENSVKNRFADILKNEAAGWRAWEIAWLLGACAVIVALSVYWKDTPMGIISATDGAGSVKIMIVRASLRRCSVLRYV